MLKPRDERRSVVTWTIIRSILWFSIMLYAGKRGYSSVISSPWSLVFAYEFAYYLLRSEKAERDYKDAVARREWWEEQERQGKVVNGLPPKDT